MAVICTSRSRNFPVGMPATARRNPGPAGRATAGSRALAALGAGLGEVEVLDHDRPRAVLPGGGDQAADRGPQPPVPGGGGQPGQVQRHRERDAEHVPVRRDDGDGEVAGVDVDRHHRVRAAVPPATGRGRAATFHDPSRYQRPEAGSQRDVVADRAGGGLGGDLVAPVGELDRARQPVPAVGPVRQVRERGGELDFQPALVGVATGSSRCPRPCPASPSAVRNRRAASHWPPPLVLGQPGGGQVPRLRSRPRPPRVTDTARPLPAGPPAPAGPSGPAGGWPWRAARLGSRTRAPGRSSRPPGRRAVPRPGGPGPAGWPARRAGSGRRAATRPRWSG